MTPTADLMRLVEKLIEAARDAEATCIHAESHTQMAATEKALTAAKDALTDALSALGEALVGGDVVREEVVQKVEDRLTAVYMEHEDYRVTCKLVHDFAEAAVDALATPAHPKASEEQDDRDRLVGSVLDAWEMLPNDVKCEVKECALGNSLDALLDWMENEQPVPSHVKAPRAVRKTATDHPKAPTCWNCDEQRADCKCITDDGPAQPKASESKAGGEDARDAARYRWLRDAQLSDEEEQTDPRLWEKAYQALGQCWTAEEIDAAIDATMPTTLTAPGADDGQ